MVELKQIQYFVTCVQTGSFSRAAERLYTTQPSVSKVIKSMEDQMHVQLFERYAKGISLTPEGEHIFHYACTILDSLEKMQSQDTGTYREQLLISCNPSSWFADRFVEFYQEHENDNLYYQIYSAGIHEIVKRIQERTDDIGFVYVMKDQLAAFQYFIARNYLRFEPLQQTDVMMYHGKKQYTGRKREAKPEKLSELRLIQRFPDEFSPDNYRDLHDREGNSASDAEVVVTTNSDYIMRSLLQNSDLVNISGAYLSGRQAGKGEAIRLSDGNEGQLLYGYLCRRGEKLPKWAAVFVNFLRDKLNENNGMDIHSEKE